FGPGGAALLMFVGPQQSAPLGFALFFTLGLGMGAPYVALAALAGRLRRMPRGGAWLAWVEQVFAFVLLGMALFFAAPLMPPGWARVAATVILASAAVVLGFLGEMGLRPAGRAAWRCPPRRPAASSERRRRAPSRGRRSARRRWPARSRPAARCSSTSRRSGASPAARWTAPRSATPPSCAPRRASPRSRST